jgi:hypothetical protein
MTRLEMIEKAIEALQDFRQDAADKAHVDRAIGALMMQRSQLQFVTSLLDAGVPHV